MQELHAVIFRDPLRSLNLLFVLLAVADRQRNHIFFPVPRNCQTQAGSAVHAAAEQYESPSIFFRRILRPAPFPGPFSLFFAHSLLSFFAFFAPFTL